MESKRQPFHPTKGRFAISMVDLRLFCGHLVFSASDLGFNPCLSYAQLIKALYIDRLSGTISSRKGSEMRASTGLSLLPLSIETIEEDPHNFGVKLGIGFSCDDINGPIDGETLMK